MEPTKATYPPQFQSKLDHFPDFASYFKTLSQEEQEKLVRIFLDDNLIFPATYDTVFKFVFDPKRHPERLSRFLSLLLKQNITVIAQLPSETQRITLDFPMQRAAVHSARLINQQYQTVKSQKKAALRYTDVRKVYTVIFFVDHASVFDAFPSTYLHHSKHRTQNGLELDLLQEYFFVELGKFEKNEKQINTEEKAWLKLLMAHDFDTLQSLSSTFSALQEPAKDVILFSKQTKEVPRMIWDTDEYLIKDMLERATKERDTAVAARDAAFADRDAAFADRDAAFADRDVAFADRDAAFADRDAAFADRDAAILVCHVFRLFQKHYTADEIATQLSLSIDRVQAILNED